MKPETLSTWMVAAGGRRFLLTCGCSALNSGFFFLGKLSEAGYLNILMMTVGAYLCANGMQRFTDAKWGKTQDKDGDGK